MVFELLINKYKINIMGFELLINKYKINIMGLRPIHVQYNN